VKGEEERVLPILVVALRHAELVGARHAIDLDGSRSGGDGLESTAAALRSAARACRTRAGRRRSCARRSARSHHSGRLAGAGAATPACPTPAGGLGLPMETAPARPPVIGAPRVSVAAVPPAPD
jgi:hypothetical protein